MERLIGGAKGDYVGQVFNLPFVIIRVMAGWKPAPRSSKPAQSQHCQSITTLSINRVLPT